MGSRDRPQGSCGVLFLSGSFHRSDNTASVIRFSIACFASSSLNTMSFIGVGPWSVTVRKIGFGESPKVWNRNLQKPESMPGFSNALLEPHSLLEAYT